MGLVDDGGELVAAHRTEVLEGGAGGEEGGQDALGALGPHCLLQVRIGPRQRAELAKVDLAVAVGVDARQHALDLGVGVREPVGAHEPGEAALAHAAPGALLGAVAVGAQVGVRVKLTAPLSEVHHAEREHQLVRHPWRRLLRGVMLRWKG